MTNKSKLMIALGASMLAAVAYAVGRYQGANEAALVFRSLSFGTRENELRRELEMLDHLKQGELQKLGDRIAGLAWSNYVSLEEDAASTHLPATAEMRERIQQIRALVTARCSGASPLSLRHPITNVCTERAKRSNNGADAVKDGRFTLGSARRATHR